LTVSAAPAGLGPGAGEQQSAAGTARSGLPVRWRSPLLIAGFVLLCGVVIALLVPSGSGPVNTYLDPTSVSSSGARALADILAGRGTRVVPVYTPAAALATVRRGATTIVITSPGVLTGRELSLLAAAPASLLVVGPDPAALSALAPAVTATGQYGLLRAQPGCALPSARLAGNADVGGLGMRLAPDVAGVACYHTQGAAFLISYTAGSRTTTVLGSGTAMQNRYLARLGNAALTLNLLSYRGTVAWLVSQPTAASAPARTVSSFWGLVPLGAYLVAAELGIAVVLTALWRARRFGPLVSEQLPVPVRASETTEGHARLYQAHRSRDQAGAALRDGVLSRLIPALGLPPSAPRDALVARVAQRSTLSQARVSELLFGPPPDSDTALVRLADDLDALEREVRTS
jgi:hypothetical protein